MKRITLHALGSFDIKNKDYLLENDQLPLRVFLTNHLLENEDMLSMFFPKGDNQITYIIFVNGVIIRDEGYLLENEDKILITPMMGGG